MSEACPCCGYLTLSERGTHEICGVCFWEDDGRTASLDEVRDGPNGRLSLTRAQENYRAYGACERRYLVNVRLPSASEIA
ncbi:CPCC family cysteine-rich protein [Sphingomonas oligophenolica]|uniref:CPCC family cysteine-rich protein n=1 Tax=Sphingomonas oligophenolica TaxID=301154 RepID=UPI003CD0872F